MSEFDHILDYWFEGVSDSAVIKNDSLPFCKWFSGGPKVDREIKERFEGWLLQAATGKYKHWEPSAQGCLALIILFDQFSRNIYRQTAKMYDFDSLALNLALKLVNSGDDKKLQIIERMFVYLPFSHSEELAIQKQGLRCLRDAVDEVKQKYPQNSAYYEKNLYYANRHCEIVERFSRFPHRNGILNRPSTQEEVQFLREPNSKF